MLKLSIAGDTAKYLDFTLPIGGALSPHDSTCIETRSFRSLPLDQMDVFHPITPYHLLSIWLSYCNLYDPGRAHNAMWLHLKLLNRWHLKSLCSWVAFHK